MENETAADTLAALAAQRVAEGTSSTIESAIWSITYGNGYRQGRSDALSDRGSCCQANAAEGYRAGYARGYRWTIDHPVRLNAELG